MMIDWARDRLGVGFRDDARAIGCRDDDGELVGVVIYDTFSSTFCHVHIVGSPGRRWFTRDFLVHAMMYPFRTCALPRVSALISEHNEAALALAYKAGFVEEGLMRRGGSDGDDLVLLGLLRDDAEALWLSAKMIERSARRFAIL